MPIAFGFLLVGVALLRHAPSGPVHESPRTASIHEQASNKPLIAPYIGRSQSVERQEPPPFKGTDVSSSQTPVRNDEDDWSTDDRRSPIVPITVETSRGNYTFYNFHSAVEFAREGERIIVHGDILLYAGFSVEREIKLNFEGEILLSNDPLAPQY